MGPLSSVNPNTVASSLSRPDKASATDRPPTFGDRFQTIPPRVWALAIGMAALGWAYWPNFQYLYSIWDFEPNYSHGKLVIPIGPGNPLAAAGGHQGSLDRGSRPMVELDRLGGDPGGRGYSLTRITAFGWRPPLSCRPWPV